MSSKRKWASEALGAAEAAAPVSKKARPSEPFTIQIVTGSYDRVLHGITATVSPDDETVEFADTFLFNAHSSAIRCLALSSPSAPEPKKGQKVMLATGSTDERINVYSTSAHAPRTRKGHDNDLLSAIAPRKILENSKNRELGTLLNHNSTITRLSFPTKGKLISASEDSTIAVTRARDWSVLSSIKVPVPKAEGRPSGDTAALGSAPCGVNDFAVHPSMKLMISVSKGERSMRLWNLMTAKKAGVLNFGREQLQEVGEGRFTSGEGRRVVWDVAGEEICVAFDKNALVFGMDGVPRCKIFEGNGRKIHEVCYVATGVEEESVLAISTEDGMILFLSTKEGDLAPPKEPESVNGSAAKAPASQLPVAKLVAQLGGKAAGVTGRIKDFAVLRRSGGKGEQLFFACGGSDGKVRLFKMALKDLVEATKAKTAKQTGKLLGSYETQNRITCLEGFIMIPRPEGVEESDEEEELEVEEEDDDEDDD